MNNERSIAMKKILSGAMIALMAGGVFAAESVPETEKKRGPGGVKAM